MTTVTWRDHDTLGREYCDIRSQTGHGRTPATRTPRQVEIVNAIVGHAERYVRKLARKVKRTGVIELVSYGQRFVRSELETALTTDDLSQAGIAYVVGCFGTYSAERGAVSTYVVNTSRWGMFHAITADGQIHVARNAAQGSYVHKREENKMAVQRARSPCLSLSEPLGDGDYTLEDIIPDQNETAYTGRLDRILVNRLLTTLSERERRVLSMRYGLEGEEMLLREIGTELGLNRERIRQIEHEALGKLRKKCTDLALLPHQRY